MQKISDAETLLKLSFLIRNSVVRMLCKAGSGHLGGSLSLADICTTLYFNTLNHQPNNPDWPDRDRVILSAGHLAPVLYATLAHAGYFEIEELYSLRKVGSRLQGHPAKDKGLPGIETSSGSLGQGLSIALGMALAAKIDSQKITIHTLMGDGELQEGQVWEAAMAAAHHKLDNLIAIVDKNGLQIDGKISDVMNLEPLRNKWESFGWNVIECNGHNFNELIVSFESAKKSSKKPTVILARTIMGKGIKTIENDSRWHGKVPGQNEIADFLCQLEESYKAELNQPNL